MRPADRKCWKNIQRQQNFDWVGFLVRFVVGAVFGVFFAFGILSTRNLYATFLEDESLLWIGVASLSLLMGFVFAMLGSDYWNSFLDGRFRR